MLETVEVECPYCGERVEVDLDPESRGQMVRDCDVCCNPWLMTVRWDADGTPEVRVEAAQ
jgi:prolyl-tRNA synthetase